MFSFCKMQATGNDFIIVDCVKNKFNYILKNLAEYLCNRKLGIGADGILIIDKSNSADFKFRIFNSDGSEAEMCGNGIRCACKYVYEHNIITKNKMNVETLAGIKNVYLKIEGNTVISIKVNMGVPQFEFDEIPVYIEEEFNVIHTNSEIKGIRILENIFYPISIGNPHIVCFCENVDNINVAEIGKKVENYKYFPNRTNVEFVEVINDNKIKIRVWERGVGETLSCGTGACASAVIFSLIKSTESEISVDLKGGNLKVFYNRLQNEVYLEGSANEVFLGNMYI